MGIYNSATICLNGHVISSTRFDYTSYCDKCGNKSISICPSCNTVIRGAYENEIAIDFHYQAPSFCYSCGNPFPWIETLINNAVELIALDDNLSEENKAIIKSALPDLIVETPTTPLAAAKYKKFVPKAAKYIQDGLRNLLVDVASEAVKKSLWS
ncbi:DUF2321 domain-containing protein [Butyricicoccus sp. 1XD8-22]|nr:DUF2321 domain-containing protein [Butyricicoccus sp. 1XD8-22]